MSPLSRDLTLCCISFTIMQERNIVEALSGDRHFQQAGSVGLLWGVETVPDTPFFLGDCLTRVVV